MNRRKKTAINLFTSLTYEIVTIICGLISPRLVLRAFGSSYNGVISSVTQLLSMISILTLGISGAVRAELYHSLAARDIKATSMIMKAATDYMRKVGLALLAFAGVLVFAFPLFSHSDVSPRDSALIIGIVTIDSFCLYYFGTANYSLLIADQKAFIKHILGIIAKILSTIIIAIIISWKGNIFTVKGASAVVMTLPPVGVALYVKYHYHLDTKCEAKKDALKKRKDAAIHSLANIVHDNADTIILTAFLDIKYVSVYTVYYAIVGKIKALLQSTASSIEAAIGNMWANREMEALQRSFRVYEYAMSVTVVIIFSCIGSLLIPFIALYTAGVHDVNYLRTDFALLITAAEAAFCIRQPYKSLVYAAGLFKETKKAAITEAIINLSVSLVLVFAMGLNGVVIGTLAANLYRTLSYGRFISEHVLHRKMQIVIARIVWSFSGLALAIACSTVVVPLIGIQGWTGWILKAFLAFGVSITVTLLLSIIFYPSDLRMAFTSLHKKMRHQRMS